MLKRTLPVLWLSAVSAFAVDVTTYHNDNARTGQNLNETILTPSNVAFATFGKLFVIAVDGKVDAEPLYVSAVAFPAPLGTHNALYVVTEHDSAYAFDADTGAQLWKVSLLKSGEVTSDDRGCSQVTPEIGITSTPVISRSSGPNGAIYVVAMSKDASSNYFQRLHALDLTTGGELFGGPRDVQATFPGTGAGSVGGNVIFDPKQYEERASLLLLDGVIYTGWTSHCDIPPYTGWVIGYSASSLAQTSVFNFTPNGTDGSVWMAGAGLAADSTSNIYFLAANGTFDTTLTASGFPNRGDYGNAFMKLSTTGGSLAVADYFTMYNTASESNTDVDLGSGGALVLPDLIDSTGATRHLAVGAGKDNHIYLVDRDNMGKFNSGANGNYQDLPSALPGGEWAMPAYFNNRIYYGGVDDTIKAFQFANARLASTPVWTTANSFGYPGATPSISANGIANGIVWAAQNSNPAVLYAYDAGDLHPLYNSNQASGTRDQFGAGNKFITPMIANGKVYVGTTNGVGVFGILQGNPPPPPAITSPGTASGSAGKPFSYQITATNNPASYSATPLPSGLSLNASTGRISGTPTTSGTTNVTIGATNSNGTGTATLVISIRGKKH
jgi:Putative Ig domain